MRSCGIIILMASTDEEPDATYVENLTRVTIGVPQRLRGRVELREYDDAWPGLFEREAMRLRAQLGDRAVRIEHVGSTSVPGLAAKAILDIVLEVADSSNEPAYVPDLESGGYGLRIREPDWFAHRLFSGPDTDVNLHVFSAGCSETDRMVRFREWLRRNPADRELYVSAKRELALREWRYLQQYADAKTEVIDAIMARAGRL